MLPSVQSHTHTHLPIGGARSEMRSDSQVSAAASSGWAKRPLAAGDARLTHLTPPGPEPRPCARRASPALGDAAAPPARAGGAARRGGPGGGGAGTLKGPRRRGGL